MNSDNKVMPNSLEAEQAVLASMLIDNTVAEATYKIIKTEFAFNKRFENLKNLEQELFDYIN